METSRLRFIRSLASHFHPGTEGSLYRYLSEEERRELEREGQSSQRATLLPRLRSAKAQLSKLHYSWLVAPLELLPRSLQFSTATSLPEEMHKPLLMALGYKGAGRRAAPLAQLWLQRALFSSVGLDQVVPIEEVADSPLKELCGWSKQELVELVDLLALRDLVPFLRQIVDKEHLQTIYRLLSKEQRTYLRLLFHRQEKRVAPPLTMNDWHHSAKRLMHRLHLRGLMRLGRALAGSEQRWLVWHLTHLLDKGRGEVVARQWEVAGERDQVGELLYQQLIEVSQYLGNRRREL